MNGRRRVKSLLRCRQNDRFPAARYNRRSMPEEPQPTTAPREPDSSRVFALLLKLGMDPEDAYAFVQEVQSMAAENLIARFESRLETTANRLESKLDVQAVELRSFRRFIAGAIILLAALAALIQLLLTARATG